MNTFSVSRLALTLLYGTRQTGIDNACHIGGLIAGGALGWLSAGVLSIPLLLPDGTPFPGRYLLVFLATGGALFIEAMDYGQGMLYGFKFIGGILVIGMMEMVLVRQKKNKPTGMFWALFAVFLFVTMFLGFKLQMGINFLA